MYISSEALDFHKTSHFVDGLSFKLDVCTCTCMSSFIYQFSHPFIHPSTYLVSTCLYNYAQLKSL